MAIKCPKCHFENPDNTVYCGKCASPLKPAEAVSVTKTMETQIEDLNRGTIFAERYEIIEELGKGGMGTVYRVEDTKIGQEIALKLIKPEIASDKKTIERFRNELKTTRMISHRNVCRMFDLSDAEGTHFITMEYIPGEDLKSFIKRARRLDTETAIEVAKQVCEGLAEAHRLGVVHRDLKSNNIMIDKEGNARIMDFGIARSLRAKGITGEGVIIGTPEYMSPEQAEAKEIDHRSDIYSLGVILYEIVTGQLPFEGDTPLSIAMKHKSEKPKSPRELNTQIGVDLNNLILKCMEKDKEKRYQSAGGICAELDRIEKAIPSSERVVLERKLEAKRRLHPILAFGILILVAVIIVMGYFLLDRIFQTGKPESETLSTAKWKNSIGVLPFRDLSPQRDQEHFCFGMTDAINDRLTQLGHLKVSATTSVMRYKDTQKAIEEIGAELGVANILEGSVLIEGDRIRVRGQLIDAETGFHVWSKTYENKLESVFDVYDEVSQAIAEALKLKFAPDALTSLKKEKPNNMEAYEYYLKGMNFLSSRYFITLEEEDFRTAVSMFEKSIEIDRNYALAYAGLAWGYLHRARYFRSQEAWNEARKYTDKAYKLDPDSAITNAMKGIIYQFNGEYEKAFAFFKYAMKMNPNIHEVNFAVGVACRQLGLYYKAIKYLNRARELDPYYFVSLGTLGVSYMFLGELEKSGIYLDKAYAINPNTLLSFHTYANIMMGKYDKAEEIIRKMEETNPELSWIQNRKALLYAVKGDRDKALSTAKDAEIYSVLGMKDEAIQYIDERLDHPRVYPYLSLINLPVYDNLRDDPRFKEIIKKKKKKYEELLNMSSGL